MGDPHLVEEGEEVVVVEQHALEEAQLELEVEKKAQKS